MTSSPASPSEIRRLIKQAAIVRPITERLLRLAGIGAGMHVLDVGCSAGDVSFLAAELIGSSGAVIGIDRRSGVVAIARERAQKRKLDHVTFRDVELEAITDAGSFDAVIGRYVLMRHAEPENVLRTVARLVRPGGIIAIHEGDCTIVKSAPFVRVWDAAGQTLLAAWREVLPGHSHNAVARLIDLFSQRRCAAARTFLRDPHVRR